MSIYLHHYPASLFSEKVRLLLGYFGATWQSVEIPAIMPRPLLMPLSGGYRKTPVLQIGANVYCDTKIIARGLARHFDNDELYVHGFTAHRVADWADTHLFQVTVALNFSPEAVSAMMGRFSPEEAAAFQKDRADLTKGASIVSFSAEAAGAYLRHYLDELNDAVTDDYLFGRTPSIADFAVYHCLWFVANNPVNATRLDRYGNVRVWMDRMAAFGHGRVEECGGEAVTVTPVDYGRIPVAGTLAAWSAEEVVIERETDETGRVLVHFPSPGFEVSSA